MIRFVRRQIHLVRICRRLSHSKYATETYQIPPRSDLVNSLKTNMEFDLLIIGGGATGSGSLQFLLPCNVLTSMTFCRSSIRCSKERLEGCLYWKRRLCFWYFFQIHKVAVGRKQIPGASLRFPFQHWRTALQAAFCDDQVLHRWLQDGPELSSWEKVHASWAASSNKLASHCSAPVQVVDLASSFWLSSRCYWSYWSLSHILQIRKFFYHMLMILVSEYASMIPLVSFPVLPLTSWPPHEPSASFPSWRTT